MRIAAILCPGPSLPATFPTGEAAAGAAFTVAVNAAIHHQPAGFRPCWWLGMDGPWWDMAGLPAIAPHQLPKIGFAGMVSRLAGEPIANGMAIVDLVHMLDHHPVFMRTWSICAALFFVRMQGATGARIYGCDQAGAGDFTGATGPSDRSPDRWRREREALADAVAYMRTLGLSVERVTPEGASTWA
jgi:hypothetical protein